MGEETQTLLLPYARGRGRGLDHCVKWWGKGRGLDHCVKWREGQPVCPLRSGREETAHTHLSYLKSQLSQLDKMKSIKIGKKEVTLSLIPDTNSLT